MFHFTEGQISHKQGPHSRVGIPQVRVNNLPVKTGKGDHLGYGITDKGIDSHPGRNLGHKDSWSFQQESQKDQGANDEKGNIILSLPCHMDRF